MHELSLSESITDLVVDYARREHVARVSRVVIDIGAAASVDPQALLFCFPITTVGTVAAGAELVINRIALKVRCEACRPNMPRRRRSRRARPAAVARTILEGREMRVVAFEGE